MKAELTEYHTKELTKHLLFRKQMIDFTRSELKIIASKLTDFENTEYLKEQILESIFLLDNAVDYLDNVISINQKKINL